MKLTRLVLLSSALALMGGIFAAGDAAGEPPHPHEPEYGPDIEFPPEYEAPSRERRAAPTERVEKRVVPSEGGILQIPGGEFSMGYDGPVPHEPNERPAHAVRVATFGMDRTGVAVGGVGGGMGRGACPARLGPGPVCTRGRVEPKVPVNCVPCQAADASCRALGKRLPTE